MDTNLGELAQKSNCGTSLLLGLALVVGKDIVFRFIIIEYNSLRDFGPLGYRSTFISEDF